MSALFAFGSAACGTDAGEGAPATSRLGCTDPAACGANAPCSASADCASGECSNGKCTAPLTASVPRGDDGQKNGDESDVDCGGTTTNAPRCEIGKGCNVGDDCQSKVCSPANTCAAPTATDKVQNGDETDVDCGGASTNAPKCTVGKSCLIHADCELDGCDDQHKCAVGRSCTQTDGGRTCGTGEVGDPGAKHESCCLALPIPDSTTKLDKYKITAGRMRAFIERVNGNVQGWFDDNKANLSATAIGQIEPWRDSLPTDLNTYPRGANYQLGATIVLTDRPSVLQGCYTGSAKDPAYGAHTYFTGKLEGEDRAFDQAFLDRLPLNCVPFPVLAAFCAWDGGRVQTFEENSAAYGDGDYPWGDAPAAGGFTDGDNGGWEVFGPATGASFASCPTCDTDRMNWLTNYQNPAGGVPAKDWDLAYFISAPGRFPQDVGAGGHMDIGGLMMELTASPGADDPSYGTTVRWSRAGSWEGHPANSSTWAYPIMTKYGKTGGRCARD
jgi:hypothetical protein